MIEVETRADKTTQFFRRVQNPEALDPALQSGANEFVRYAQVYPPQKHVEQGFATDRSRRKFFVMLRRGEITVPYRRKYVLQRSWGVKRVAPNLWYAGNTASYAGLLHSLKRRTRAHKKRGWLTVSEIWRARNAAIKRKFNDEVLRLIRKR